MKKDDLSKYVKVHDWYTSQTSVYDHENQTTTTTINTSDKPRTKPDNI